jgi:hypothetical protein
MKTAELLIALRAAADVFEVDALRARAIEASSVRLTAEGAAALAQLMRRAAAALDNSTAKPGEG